MPTLTRAVFRKLFRLNDRHGELFLYMHRQMLARYDAELLSHGLQPVKPFTATQWPNPIRRAMTPKACRTNKGRRSRLAARTGDSRHPS